MRYMLWGDERSGEGPLLGLHSHTVTDPSSIVVAGEAHSEDEYLSHLSSVNETFSRGVCQERGSGLASPLEDGRKERGYRKRNELEGIFHCNNLSPLHFRSFSCIVVF
jgi:hypothetical protein